MAKKILVIDDSQSIRELITMVLENVGYLVDSAVDGQDALQYFDGRDFNLVITDLSMPNMDGIALLKKIRAMQQYSTVPVLMLTTESQNSVKAEAKMAGATGWVIKPFVANKLLSVINKVIR
jgi:two-component system chemotaxis response regulator CheY